MNPIANHPCQLQMWRSQARFLCVPAGRRFGKTFVSREKLLKSCDVTKKGLFWYVAPTRQHAKDLMWDDLKESFIKKKWAFEKDETALAIIRKKTKTKIVLRSAEKYDRLRGKGLDGVIFDEVADIDKRAWSEAVRPALSDKRGWGWFIGSPKGFNWFYDLCQSAKTRDNWDYFQFKTIDSPFFQTPEGIQELKDAKADLDDRTYRQEYEASFESFSGRICHAFDRAKNHIDYEYNKDLPIIAGFDFNVLPMSVCLFQKVENKLFQFGEMSVLTSNTEEVCRELKRKFPNKKIDVRPDATGKNKYPTGDRSSFEIIQSYGYTINCDRSNPTRVDRWAAQNRAYEKGFVMVNCNACPKTAKDLETLCYKEGVCEPDLKGKLHGHLFDANGYAIFREFPIISKKRSKMIQL